MDDVDEGLTISFVCVVLVVVVGGNEVINDSVVFCIVFNDVGLLVDVIGDGNRVVVIDGNKVDVDVKIDVHKIRSYFRDVSS